MKCRHCQTELQHTFVDLGTAPPSNAYLSEQQLNAPEIWYPLKVLVCHNCWLVQTEDFVNAESLFSEDYAYFSSYSLSWIEHAKHYVSHISQQLRLQADSLVVEIAANDGYLLQFFKEKKIPCYGIEPTLSTAAAAKEKGIDVIEEFFDVPLAERLVSQNKQADLIVANNVLAHVPDINGFVKGISLLLKPGAVATFEFPHLVNLVTSNQFDTIYHEHYSYLSLTTVQRIFKTNGLSIYDVEKLPTHGGSLRIYAQHSGTGSKPVTSKVEDLLKYESRAGVSALDYYQKFQISANKVKNELLKFLITARQEGKKVAAYGAAAKGNTLINYAGIKRDLISCVIDKNPAKQGGFLPGSRIPIVDETHLAQERPDLVVILPWNLRDEITKQLAYIRNWGGQFATAVPKLEVF
ncbi:class I SAM-dependent methyltransferase [Exilibacterium tricleocarpae]|uniref:Class I SAM-dependent methyltransferase n=1 Tax=Exilibacterium tricleocarpae TaxID=2591008 RepID=A0A545TQI4_9GAMM|nr:class I SAM-dependent methyltransferase [Exilibacterium tricleocarpae]TQV79467.1 class I SAM-dependent methyltransferase [Exilibacterium tricleocarpae]